MRRRIGNKVITEFGELVVSKQGNILGTTCAARQAKEFSRLYHPKCSQAEVAFALEGQGHLELFPEFTSLNNSLALPSRK